MNTWQSDILIIYGIGALLCTCKGFYQSAVKKNPYGKSVWIQAYGAFVWGDAAVFGIFWAMATLLSYYLGNWTLFLLFISTFLLVRSIGETIYWFLQQFTHKPLDPPETLPFHTLFPKNSIWFVYQIFWQCVTVLSIISTVYLFYQLLIVQ